MNEPSKRTWGPPSGAGRRGSFVVGCIGETENWQHVLTLFSSEALVGGIYNEAGPECG
jgi:hypothetical protein